MKYRVTNFDGFVEAMFVSCISAYTFIKNDTGNGNFEIFRNDSWRKICSRKDIFKSIITFDDAFKKANYLWFSDETSRYNQQFGYCKSFSK